MTPDWEPIAERLRDELADYGELLRLFEEQQRAIFGQEPDLVLQQAGAIETQTRTAANRRLQREAAVDAFALARGRPAPATLRAVLPLVAAEAQPLIDALRLEVNHLIYRVRRASRQNRMLLARVVEINQETLQFLRPNAFTKTYSPAGRVSVAATDRPSTLRAAG